MKTHVILIHGFNVSDAGAGSVGRLAPFFHLKGCTTEIFDYGHFNLFAPRWRNKGVAERLADRVRDIEVTDSRCIVVGHSNGSTIMHMAADMGARIDKAVYISPALDRFVRFPDSMVAFDVWHNPHDRVVSLARLLPFHPWGDMGKTGFTRFDPRGRNFNMVNYASGKGDAHSKPFSYASIQVLGPAIVDRALTQRD